MTVFFWEEGFSMICVIKEIYIYICEYFVILDNDLVSSGNDIIKKWYYLRFK